MIAFQEIRARAAARKGGDPALAALIGDAPDVSALADVPDSRFLSEMTKGVFRAGFVWRVIENKWPGFEAAFLAFEPGPLLFQPDEFWEELARDARIVRNPQKIASVRKNARFVGDIAVEHGGFGAFLAGWPPSDQVGLLALLSKRGSRLGGATGQYFLRFVGWDAFVLSRDVVAALRSAGLEIADTPSSKRDRTAIQAAFDTWRDETGLSNRQISRALALSVGENRVMGA